MANISLEAVVHNSYRAHWEEPFSQKNIIVELVALETNYFAVCNAASLPPGSFLTIAIQIVHLIVLSIILGWSQNYSESVLGMVF